MGDLVADIARLMDQLDLRNAIFVGLSIGGVVAQGLTAERSELVRAAVLCDTAAKIGTEATWRDRMAQVRTGGIDAIADGVMEKWFTKAFHSERAEELAAWRHMLVRTPVDGYVGCCAAMAGTDLRDSTAALRLPVLALVGDADGSTPPDLVRETAESIAGSRFEIIRGAGHIPCVEAPEATARLIGGFISEHAAD
jgi:3-oxoadipate enol-lactonase